MEETKFAQNDKQRAKLVDDEVTALL